MQIFKARMEQNKMGKASTERNSFRMFIRYHNAICVIKEWHRFLHGRTSVLDSICVIIT